MHHLIMLAICSMYVICLNTHAMQNNLESIPVRQELHRYIPPIASLIAQNNTPNPVVFKAPHDLLTDVIKDLETVNTWYQKSPDLWSSATTSRIAHAEKYSQTYTANALNTPIPLERMLQQIGKLKVADYLGILELTERYTVELAHALKKSLYIPRLDDILLPPALSLHLKHCFEQKFPVKALLYKQRNYDHPAQSVAFSDDSKKWAVVARYVCETIDAHSQEVVATVWHESPISAFIFRYDNNDYGTTTFDHNKTAYFSAINKFSTLPIICKGIDHYGTTDLLALKAAPATLWVLCGELKKSFSPTDEYSPVVISPNGKLLATGFKLANGNLIGLISLEGTYPIIHEYTYDSDLHALSFSPDSTTIALGRSNGLINLIDVSSHHESWVSIILGTTILSLAFSPDGKYLAAGVDDSTARIFDASTGNCLLTLPHEGSVASVAYSPDQKYLATASRDHHKGIARLYALYHCPLPYEELSLAQMHFILICDKHENRLSLTRALSDERDALMELRHVWDSFSSSQQKKLRKEYPHIPY